jgi:hypothetical protein
MIADVAELTHDADEEVRRVRRLERAREEHRYAGVLGFVLVVFFFSALAPTNKWSLALIVLLQAAMLTLALWTGGRSNIGRAELGVIAVTIGFLAVDLAFGDDKDVYGSVSLYSALLTVGTILVIGRGVARQPAINLQSVTGAIAIYLLIGLFFVYVYGAVDKLSAAQFFVQTAQASRPLLQYFSYVTLATVGYGDYTAAGKLGRMLAVSEALLGQLYLVTVLAILVSQLGRPRTKMHS